MVVLVWMVIVLGVHYAGIWNGPPACKHLVGFYMRGDKMVNVYAPCHHDYCDNDPTPKDCG